MIRLSVFSGQFSGVFDTGLAKHRFGDISSQIKTDRVDNRFPLFNYN